MYILHWMLCHDCEEKIYFHTDLREDYQKEYEEIHKGHNYEWVNDYEGGFDHGKVLGYPEVHAQHKDIEIFKIKDNFKISGNRIKTSDIKDNIDEIKVIFSNQIEKNNGEISESIRKIIDHIDKDVLPISIKGITLEYWKSRIFVKNLLDLMNEGMIKYYESSTNCEQCLNSKFEKMKTCSRIYGEATCLAFGKELCVNQEYIFSVEGNCAAFNPKKQ